MTESSPDARAHIATDVATDVAVVGAGPTGMLLAAEVAMRGVRVVVLEREVERPTFVRAFNLNARSLELLDRRGIVERFLAEGPRVPHTHFAAVDGALDLSEMDTDHPYTLGIAQTRTEALLEAYALDRGARIRRGHAVTDVAQDDSGVIACVEHGEGSYRLHARWLVGCDGGRSTIRKRAGIGFPGTAATRWTLLGDVELADPTTLSYGTHETARGNVFVIPRPGYVRVITGELARPADADAPVSLEELTAAVGHVLGRDVAFVRPRWLTRFGDAARLAERYRVGRILLAGDAAHVHPPAGAQGLNVGLQDAFNLGWKLAAAARGEASVDLLDSYHDERHAVGERILVQTRAQTALGLSDERLAPVRALVRELALDPTVRRMLAEMVTGIDTRYVLGAPEVMLRQPWLGRLAPNVALDATHGRTTLAACLRDGRALLVLRGARPDLEAVIEPMRTRIVVASVADARSSWLGGAEAALVRPDGHIAWMATGLEDGDASLGVAAAKWLGGAAPSAVAKPSISADRMA